MTAMRNLLLVVLAVFPVASAFAGMPRHPLPVQREGEVLVTWRDAVVAKQAGPAKAELGLTVRRQLRGGRVELLSLPSYMSTDNAIALLRDDPAVERAGPNFLRYPRQTLPDDTSFGDQWGLHNTGQANFAPSGPASVVDADMDLPEAWDSDTDGIFDRTGDGAVTIAIIDDSFKTDHPDLAANFIAGYNFENNNTNVSPVGDEEHGTLVAGAAGAIGDNGVGVAGTAWNVKLMPLKFDFDVATHIAALEYAAAHGADIVNASFGGPGYDRARRTRSSRSATSCTSPPPATTTRTPISRS
jgi:subtilisin family serine protease